MYKIDKEYFKEKNSEIYKKIIIPYDLTLMNGLVDVLIDPRDPKVYFVDFNIQEDYGDC